MSVTVQAGLCLTWSETPKTGFLASRLNFFLHCRFWDTNLQLTPGAKVELSKDKSNKSELSITLHETPSEKMIPEEQIASESAPKVAASSDYMERLQKDAMDGQIVSLRDLNFIRVSKSCVSGAVA